MLVQLGIHSEQFGDDHRGDRIRHVGDQIELALFELADHPGGDFPRAFAPFRNRPRLEGMADQVAQPFYVRGSSIKSIDGS